MAAKSVLNAKNLEALGAEKLALLLLDISAGDANAKRRLRLELAAGESPDKLVNDIRKRLTAIATATTFVSWRGIKAFRTDLQNHLRLIVDQVATASPADALDLLWQFILMSDAVLERATDTSGDLLDIFRAAAEDLARLAALAQTDTAQLVDNLFNALLANSYGQSDTLVRNLTPVLAQAGLLALRARVLAVTDMAKPRPAQPRRTARWRRKLERDTVKRTPRAQVLRQALLDIADGLGDVDAYIALQPDPKNPATAAAIATRLLHAARPAEALTALDQALLKDTPPATWNSARIDALEALDRKDEAQAFRLTCFHRTLNPDYLRAYLKRLPDFDDIEAEDQALDAVMTLKHAAAALAFLLAWPSLDRAARLLVQRSHDIDTYADDLLELAAEKLIPRYPLAATIVLRKRIESTLRNGRIEDYITAGHQLAECARLAAHIDHFGPVDSHDTYVTKLRTGFGRRTEFWCAAG